MFIFSVYINTRFFCITSKGIFWKAYFNSCGSAFVGFVSKSGARRGRCSWKQIGMNVTCIYTWFDFIHEKINP